MEVRLEGVTHRYGELLALDNVSLEVRAGETLVLIGPSGCGKSTLLGIVGGLLRPSKGRVLLSGKPPADCLNPLTYVFQDFALLPWRSVADNIGLSLQPHALTGAERQRRIDQALSLTGLKDFAAAYPRQLSGGMRQRVGLARALVVRPAVLLLDEPLSALDAQTRALLMEEMLAIWAREASTRLYVTHNLDEALRLADRIVVLSRRPGRLREIVEVTIPLSDRGKPETAPAIANLHARLWRLIRDEAAEADREVVNG